MSRQATADVTLFGQRRRCDVRWTGRAYIAAFSGLNLETRVPGRLATNATDAALKAAAHVESMPWTRLRKHVAEAVEYDRGISTETAAWVVCKAEGRRFDRHAWAGRSAEVCSRAKTLLSAAIAKATQP